MIRPLHLLFILVLAPSLAMAQTPPPISVNPARVEQRFEREEKTPSSSPGADIAPTAATPAVTGTARQAMAQTRFVLERVAITGVTAYRPDQLEFAYTDMLGKEISLLDAQSIARQITGLYHKDKYILSQAILPPQAISDGTLNVQVIEGYVGNVIFDGDAFDAGRRSVLETYGEQIKKRRPIGVPDMERYLLLMNDLPGATAKGTVRPSPTQYGAVDFIITVTHRPFEMSYTLDNRGSKYIGALQHTAAVTANSLLGRYDKTIARVITTSPTTELRFFDLLHEEPIGDDGAVAAVNVSQSYTRPGDVLKSAAIAGESTFAQAKASYPFLRTRRESFTGRAIFDIRNTTTDAAGLNLSKDRLRVLRLGGAYDFVDRFRAANLIDAEVSRGLNLLNASDSGAMRSRADGKSGFTKVTVDAARTQSLPDNFSLATSVNGQYASGALLAAEQFALGGASLGSAYDPSELSGDHGLGGRAELRYSQWANVSYLSYYQAYGFYDIGRVWIKNGAPGANDKTSLASTGLGLRATFTPHVYGNVEAALPLTKPAANQGDHGDAARLFFSLTGRF